MFVPSNAALRHSHPGPTDSLRLLATDQAHKCSWHQVDLKSSCWESTERESGSVVETTMELSRLGRPNSLRPCGQAEDWGNQPWCGSDILRLTMMGQQCPRSSGSKLCRCNLCDWTCSLSPTVPRVSYNPIMYNWSLYAALVNTHAGLSRCASLLQMLVTKTSCSLVAALI